MGLLARREHSRLELFQKLLLRKFPTPLINEALDLLAKEGWQDDIRFAEVYSHMRAQRGYGPLRIHAELRERGVAEAVIAQVMDEKNQLWQERLQEVYQKKFRGKLPQNFAMRAKQMRFLQYRGFSSEQIMSIMTDEQQ